MGDMLIRGIPEGLKRKIEEFAKRDGQSLSAKSIDLLRKSVDAEHEAHTKPFVSAWDVLRPILYDGNDKEAEEYTKIMEEVEAERKRDFGRPVDFGHDDDQE
ncbi:MAG: plasmid stabilization protein [Rhizobiaceae bacterium]|jgi:plasmid stability protein